MPSKRLRRAAILDCRLPLCARADIPKKSVFDPIFEVGHVTAYIHSNKPRTPSKRRYTPAFRSLGVGMKRIARLPTRIFVLIRVGPRRAWIKTQQ
jgi:hypothetical protein